MLGLCKQVLDLIANTGSVYWVSCRKLFRPVSARLPF